MNKAIQGLKTTKGVMLVGFLLLAAAIGFFGFTQHDSASSSFLDAQKPQVTQIQKHELPLQKATVRFDSSKKHYTIQPGDTYWTIAKKLKPSNVELNSYVVLLQNINLNTVLHVSNTIRVPTDEDLKTVVLPDVVLHFDYKDSIIVDHIKEAEGSLEAQSKNKRRLLGGKVGSSFHNSKFYPYKDIKGNYTIGYGHYLGRKDSDAAKYRNGLTKKEAHNLLLQDMERTYNDFILLLQRKNAVNLNKDQQRILFEMAFTMGVDKLATFNKLWKSVKHENHTKFKKEIQSSLWYKQVSNRADILLSSL